MIGYLIAAWIGSNALLVACLLRNAPSGPPPPRRGGPGGDDWWAGLVGAAGGDFAGRN